MERGELEFELDLFCLGQLFQSGFRQSFTWFPEKAIILIFGIFRFLSNDHYRSRGSAT